MPDAHYIYVFDNAAFPYGEKPEKFIIARARYIIAKIQARHKFHLIILACNTISTISLMALRKCYSYPIIGVVPAIKTAAKITRNGIIGLLATRATTRCNYVVDLIFKFAANCHVLTLDASDLVYIAESKLHGKKVPISIVHKILLPWRLSAYHPDTVVLGCTHFPLLSQELQDALPEGTRLVDSSAAIAHRTAWLVSQNIFREPFIKTYKENTAYYLKTTPKITTTITMLKSYGFRLIKLLSIG